MKSFTLPILLSLIGLSTARTDISGCVSSQTTNQWHEASMIWYVPGSGEICDFVDCGGGRAPPKTDQPGCPLYTGTETVTPSYLPGYGPNGKMAATTTTMSETTSSTHAHSTTDSSSSPVTNSSGSMITAAPTTSPVVSMTTSTSSVSKAGNSTSSAATSTQTGGASASPASNMAGVMAVIAAVVGAVSL